MNKNIIIGMVLIVGLVGAAFAFNGLGRGQTNGTVDQETRQAHQETMEQIMEEGSYADLLAQREADGIDYMPMVDSEEDFEAMQAHHKLMEEYREANGIEQGQGLEKGMMRGRGQGMRGNCPMMS
jgi:hypothetical protein